MSVQVSCCRWRSQDTPTTTEKTTTARKGVLLCGRSLRSSISLRRHLVAEAGMVVGAAGIEPATICSQSRYATAALRPAAASVTLDVGPRYPIDWTAFHGETPRESAGSRNRSVPRGIF